MNISHGVGTAFCSFDLKENQCQQCKNGSRSLFCSVVYL